MGHFIGEGNFGQVYGCTDAWGNDLAAKVLKFRDLPYEQIRHDAVSELQRLQALRHPSITYVYDAFEFRDTFYIITERCYSPLSGMIVGANFRGHLWIRAVARCILQGLHFIHCQGMVHQDVHLGNVLQGWVKDEMVPDEVASITFKLCDLGLSKVISEVDAMNTVLAKWILPPEALRPTEFGKLDERIDIYHAGLVLLQVYLGKQLHFSEDEILDGAPRKLAETLPSPYNFALSKALRRHSHHRTQSAPELWRDLTAGIEPTLGEAAAIPRD
jgi:eukaryotic-like serine/threonine-protein kinase